MRKILMLVAALVFSIVAGINTPAHAEVYKIVAEGNYTIGDRDTREMAKNHAVKDAMRIAVEKAGVYVESYSETNGCVLTKDEVKMVAAGIVRVLDESINYFDNGNVCRAVIYAEVDTDDINLEELMTSYTVGDRKYHKKQKSRPSYGEPQEMAVTALVVDYSDYRGQGNMILNLDYRDAIESEDGTIVYDATYRGIKIGDLCYQDKDYVRVMVKAGKHPIVVKPVRFKYSPINENFYRNPVLKKEDADYILAMNDKYGFLDRGAVYIIRVN